MKGLLTGGILAAGALVASAGPASAGCNNTVTISDPTVTESPSGAVAVFTISYSNGCSQPITLDYATASNTAASGSDFVAKSGSVGPIAPGGSTTVSVTVNDDLITEPNETFFLNLSAPPNQFANFSPDNQGTATIVDNDPPPTISIDDTSVTEPDSTVANATFTVTLSNPSSSTITVGYSTANGTATAPDDYAATSGTLTFSPGDLSKGITVGIVGDTLTESDETLFVNLSAATNATISDGQGKGTIVDNDPAPSSPPPRTAASGYRLVASDGGTFTFGDRTFHGSLGGQPLNKPIVGGATNPVGFDGYWLVASDGGVFTFGDANFFGSLAATPPAAPVVEIEATPSGRGYWLVDAKGTIYPYGDARNEGDASKSPPKQPIIGMSATSSGRGYWLFAADGSIFNFGDAGFYGSMGGQPLNKPIVDLAPIPGDNGYYLLGGDGGVFAFGAATFKGSLGGTPLNAPTVSMLVTPTGNGYWLGATDGGVFAFGAAEFLGSMGGTRLNGPALDFIN